jgi:hypothetical protein
MIFADMARPTETKLLPDPDPEYAVVCQHAAGIRRILPFLGKPVAPELLLVMLAEYRGTLEFLDRQRPAIAHVLAKVAGFDRAPIRVCLRGTDQYVAARAEPVWPPLLDAELEQLGRGDIPYFFRLYGKPGIRYYANRELTRTKLLPAQGDTPRLEPLLSLTSRFVSRSRKRLAEEGLFTLIGAFDHPSFAGRHERNGLAVAFGSRSLVVTLPSGEALHARRNLSAHVSSVYLPCRCGEVRTVFVPAVTRCKSSG